MLRLEFDALEITELITHQVGSPALEQGLELSEAPTHVAPATFEYLLKYFLMPFQSEDLQQFYHPSGLAAHPIYPIIQRLFESPDRLIELSKTLAEMLYDASEHPKIKPGALNVALFSNIVIEDEVVEAIGIFKSENSVPYLKMEAQESRFDIKHEHGFSLKGIDKGALILNTNVQEGYLVLVVDHKNRGGDAQFWKDGFLQVRPIVNEFHQTNEFMTLTKNYVTNQLKEEFPVNRTEQIDLLNKSVEFFKTNETFDQKSFEEEVLGKEEVIESFRKFGNQYEEQTGNQINEQFDISSQAVKKQSRVFKSVLKLDKNFHIYIHGNKDLIQFGRDEDGRKFYKIYFDEEK